MGDLFLYVGLSVGETVGSAVGVGFVGFGVGADEGDKVGS